MAKKKLTPGDFGYYYDRKQLLNGTYQSNPREEMNTLSTGMMDQYSQLAQVLGRMYSRNIDRGKILSRFEDIMHDQDDEIEINDQVKAHFCGTIEFREMIHSEMVNHCLPKVFELFSPEDRKQKDKYMDMIKARKPHDWTKDRLFYIVLAFWSDLLPTYKKMTGDEHSEYQLFKEWAKREIERHHRKEAHHPENEALNKPRVCSDEDIKEMCTDRCCRNRQFNDNNYNDIELQEFMPTFPSDQKNGNQNQLEKYKNYLSASKDFIAKTLEGKLLTKQEEKEHNRQLMKDIPEEMRETNMPRWKIVSVCKKRTPGNGRKK